jgi:hypothetical protein
VVLSKVVFFARNPDTSLEFSNSSIRNNKISAGFDLIGGAQGASVTVLDSAFENNEGIQVSNCLSHFLKFLNNAT